jgi:DNA-binding transcriptional regulator YhcF (GntR family)
MLLIDKLSGKPVYEQIVEGIEKNILMGVYPEGSVLPSLRELSVMLGINPKVHLVAPKSIARSEGKAVRVIDKRKLHD